VGSSQIGEMNISREMMTMVDCLKEFTSYEVLNRQNNYYKCENCAKENKTSSGTLRKFFFYDPPQILTVVLKRFRQLGPNRFEKVNTHIKFEENLILDPFVLRKVKKSDVAELDKTFEQVTYNYRLYAVVVHSGNLNGGHYVSYVKHIINGEEMWFYYSDTHYKPCKIENVLNSQPYILFYEMK